MNAAPPPAEQGIPGQIAFDSSQRQDALAANMLTAYGLVIPVGICSIERKLPKFLEDAKNGLSGASRALFAKLLEHFRALDRQVAELQRKINSWHRENAAAELALSP